MKIFLILILAMAGNVVSQWKKEYSPKVEEFMNIIEGHWQNFDYPPQLSEFYLTDTEIEIILGKLYLAIEDDPEGYENYIVIRNREQANDFKEMKVSSNKPTIGNIVGLIQLKIAEKYSKEFVSLITTPYYLRIKIKDKKPAIYIDKEGRPHDQTIINGEIEDVIKGKKRFNKGDNIVFMYLNSVKCSRKFENGRTYFIPFRVSTLENSNYEGLTLQWFDCNNTYLIEKEIIKIPGDYFNISEELDWESFKEQFTKTYIIFK